MIWIQDIVNLVESEFTSIALTFARVGGVVSLAPSLGERMLPVRVRLGIAVALTVVIYPIVASSYPPMAQSSWVFLWFIVTELLLGLLTSIGLRMFIFSLQIAGSIAAQATSLSQLFGTAAADPQPAIGHLLLLAGLAVSATFGLHVQIVKFVVSSYQLFPPGVPPSASHLANWGSSQVAHSFALGFSIAIPFVIAGLLYNIALGAINRAMPQLMVSFVGAPAIAMAGLVLIALLAPFMILVWKAAIIAFFIDPFGYL